MKADKTIVFTAIKYHIEKYSEVLQNQRYSGRGRRAQAVPVSAPV